MSSISSTNFYTRVGEVIRNKRRARKWSQENLAKQLDVNRVSISHIETGLQMVPLHLYMQLAQLLDISLEEFESSTPQTFCQKESQVDPLIAELITNFDREMAT